MPLTAEALARRFRYPVDVVEHLALLYSLEGVRSILGAVAAPGPYYYVRVNVLKMSPRDAVNVLRSEGFPASQHPVIREAIRFPVHGVYDVFTIGRRVVVDKHAAESIYMGADLYAPGIPKPERMERGELVTMVSPEGVPVANGIAYMSHKEIIAKWRGLAVWNIRSPYRVVSLRNHRFFSEGIIYHQSLPSMAAMHVLSPRPGETVLDMCAAPGGKATHAAEMMRDAGEVIAVDRTEKKVEKIRWHASRLGLRSVKTVVHDSRYVSEVVGRESVDKVILDPPCSALGVRPKLSYNRSLRDIKMLSEYQRQFMREAAKVLRPGGLLLYTTCTLTLEENELNVIYAASELGLTPVPVSLALGSAAFLGVPGIRFEPDVHGTPGFFIALLKKRG